MHNKKQCHRTGHWYPCQAQESLGPICLPKTCPWLLTSSWSSALDSITTWPASVTSRRTPAHSLLKHLQQQCRLQRHKPVRALRYVLTMSVEGGALQRCTCSTLP